jgi:putative ABC transport system ATP-binding protein
MIKVTDLHKTYGSKKNQFEALKGISLTIEKGETVAIIGKSGSGKSTLMHLLAGLDKPTSGDIAYDDQSLASMKPKELAKFRNLKVGFVFQQFFLQPNMNVLENVIMPLVIEGQSRKLRNQQGIRALEEVEMVDKAKNRATDLSGGQKQRVSIARAIVGEPEVIFADEPTGNLDSETGERITKLLFDLNKRKQITLVIVTHDEDLAALCDKQISIKDGVIVNVVEKAKTQKIADISKETIQVVEVSKTKKSEKTKSKSKKSRKK